MKSIEKRSTVLAINAMFLAFSIIFVYVPLPGLVTSSTLMLLPTIIITQLLGLKNGLFQALMLGILLLIKGFTYIVAPTDITLQNPLISIMPRLIFVIIEFLSIKLFEKIIRLSIKKKEERLTKKELNKDLKEERIKRFNFELEYIFSSLTSMIASLINSIFVLLTFYLFYKDKTFDQNSANPFKVTFNAILIIFSSVSVLEMVVTLLVAPPIVLASKKALNKYIIK